jgi:hypothetical protein
MKADMALMVNTVPVVVQRIVWNRYRSMKTELEMSTMTNYCFSMVEIDG